MQCGLTSTKLPNPGKRDSRIYTLRSITVDADVECLSWTPATDPGPTCRGFLTHRSNRQINRRSEHCNINNAFHYLISFTCINDNTFTAVSVCGFGTTSWKVIFSTSGPHFDCQQTASLNEAHQNRWWSITDNVQSLLFLWKCSNSLICLSTHMC